jgi:hypothetical protein
MSHMPKFDEVNDVADTLEGFEEPDVPETLSSVEVEFVVMSERESRMLESSRSLRCSNAVARLQAVIEVLEAKEDDGELADDVEQLRDDVQLIIDDAEGIEFPSMY